MLPRGRRNQALEALSSRRCAARGTGESLCCVRSADAWIGALGGRLAVLDAQDAPAARRHPSLTHRPLPSGGASSTSGPCCACSSGADPLVHSGAIYADACHNSVRTAVTASHVANSEKPVTALIYLTHTRVMRESERTVHETATHGTGRERGVCRQLISNPTRYSRWYASHEHRMQLVGRLLRRESRAPSLLGGRVEPAVRHRASRTRG